MIRYFLFITSILYLHPSLYSQENIELEDFNAITLCDSVQVHMDKVRPTLVNKKWDGQTLEIVVRTITNCNTDGLIGSFILDADTLKLMYSIGHGYSHLTGIQYQNGYELDIEEGVEYEEEIEIDLCDCYSQLYYRFNIPYLPPNLRLLSSRLYHPSEIYPIVEPSFESYKGEIVNRTDSIGNRQGIWIGFDEKGLIIQEDNYIDDGIVSTKYISHYDDGSIKEELIISDSTLQLKYHETGYLESHCVTKKIGYELFTERYKKFGHRTDIEIKTCFEYNEQGKVIGIAIGECE